ncbi:dTDP-glucose 4,6-dehydratase [Candidatus Hakubella thermalkaliphila]|uniref:dTDP-glucose 4,6-dehydratase n=2 Tax=Candidatus Hakubella thermalkaliphila TaxID=2754717 RepID=A0A6V8Q4W2_9ACTN|nr:NAD(P)-dependent oxidoreductase [Candidatus Hakubella thermalkaliphila]GFP23782.1 dTDP-glucose 4,6-dehydratase [Candidatus Hakubella thermalkaliphila]GFP30075.1 dTDP-glucose 4,6-dehydratase [Candidatus Hakubella thermalkaliphila]GFP36451.1 dTDP-glucose 4,6-dehydratase [Candidatus Hakubella thermalkaliphila]GFP39553.1 dTDP-glucose 4,6-dehydratase [Candidatus Hakubella thermalkaliphila]GFP41012.1 dTDP-glucose 4,6-dehydratase [Candidatus Hakubella thermalkaliphila]
MRILVTGGLGALGAPLARELRNRGHEVWVCDLVHSVGPNYIRCDVGNFRQVKRIFDQLDFDYVYHLAAEFGRKNGEEYYENLWVTNAIGTKNILRMQEEKKFRLIFSSSSEVYGDYGGVMEEDVLLHHPVRQLNDYAISKWVNEMQIINSAEQFGTETVRIRIFNAYGPGEHYSDYRSVVCVFSYRALMGLPYTVFLKHHRTSIYIDDAVRTMANIVDRFRPGEVYNIAGRQYHDIKYISDLILQYLGQDDSLVQYLDYEPHNTLNKKADITKSIQDLGHDPRVPLEEGIPSTIEWMKSVCELPRL